MRLVLVLDDLGAREDFFRRVLAQCEIDDVLAPLGVTCVRAYTCNRNREPCMSQGVDLHVNFFFKCTH